MFFKLSRFDFINKKNNIAIMKKIIALMVVMLGFGFTATAQQKKIVRPSVSTAQEAPKDAAVEQAALKDVAALNKVVTLTDAEKVTYKGLFEHKHRQLKANLTDDQKTVLFQSIDAKLRAGLNPAQMAKLDSNKKVLATLTH